MKILTLLGGVLLILLSFYYFTSLSAPEVGDTGTEELSPTTDDSIKTKIVSTEMYSFEALDNWIESEINVDGCVWNSISNPNDGHRMAGEVGIYPKSCFDITKATGVTDFTEVNGYYIATYYGQDSGTTAEEDIVTKRAYKKVVDTFVLKN